MTQALPPEEEQRVRVVHELGMPRGSGTAPLVAILRLLQQQTAWPMGGISLIDDKQQWFVTAFGIEATSSDRQRSLCGQVISAQAAADGSFVITDTRLDPRWAWAEQASGGASVRAYAGVALKVNDQAVGTLCVFHNEPTELSLKQLSALHDVAAVASALLDARLNERRARRQEARVRGASRASADWLWETDASGAITWISAGVEPHTGEPPESIVGRLAMEIYRSPPSEHRESFEAFQQARLNRQPFRDVIAERISPRGPLIVSLSGEPVFNSDGDFMGYRGASRDITKLIALQRRAQRAELLLRGSLEHSHAAMLITSPDGEIIVSNAAWRSLVARYLPDPPSTWPALIDALVAAGAYPEAAGREEAFAQWRRTLDQRGAGMHGLRIGDAHHLVSAQRLADGSTVHLSIDITEHRQTQTALQEQQQRLAAVLRALPDLWFVLDREGHYLDCSDEAHPLHFAPFSEVRGKLVRDVLPPDAAQAMQSALSASVATRGVQRLEYEMPVQGAPRQFEARLTPMGGDRVLLLVRDITELRSLERDVHLMQRAFEAPGSLPMTVADATQPDLPLIYVNAAFEALSGRSRHELLGRSCRFLQGRDRNQPGLTELRTALAQGRGVVVRLRNYRADGAQFINELHVAPVRDSSGRLTHFVGVQHDVTERSRAEQQLALREALYRSVTSAISDGLLVVNLRGAIVTANPAACRLLNLPQEELVGRQTRALGFQLLRDDGTPLPNESDPVTEVLRGGPNVVDRVLGMRRPDGAERVFNISAHRLLTGIEVSETACVVAFRDITEQRAAERGMIQAEARWRFALEEAGDGLIDYDEDTRRTFFSPRWKAMLGYTHQEIGQSLQEWSHRIHPEDYPRVMRTVQRYRAGELPEYRSEHRLRHKNGHWIWVLDRAKIVERRSDGSPRRVVAIYTDITRMKAADSALRDKRAAELASASKSEFLSRMSHEMRTPLNAVIGFAQLLQMRGDAGRPVPVAQYSEHIVQSGRHLLALVNDVLDLQQVEAGRMTLAPESVGLLQALQAAQRLIEPSAVMKKISISLDVDPQLTVWADPRRLQQVLLNLMSNGVKYNQVGGQLRCELESIVAEPQDEARAVLIISDTGEGLSADQMARLFQPFERLGRETTTVEGSGLGLVISRALVREMNGSLTMSSQVGTGSRVRIELPVAAPDATAPQREASAPPVAEVQPPPTLRMLYVEDNRLNALLFEEAIKMRGGVELRVVEDGPDAFELLKGWHPDVLVLDAHLPSMSGYEVLSRLRQQPQFARTPAFMCSADALPDELQRAREAGFAGYWSKPIDIAQVMKELDALPPPLPTAPAAIRP